MDKFQLIIKVICYLILRFFTLENQLKTIKMEKVEFILLKKKNYKKQEI